MIAAVANSVTHPVSKALQTPSQHLGDAYERIARLKATVQRVTFEDIYEKPWFCRRPWELK